MKPKTIVAVLESSSATKDVALARALSLANWYESDLHVVRTGPSNRSSDDAIRRELVNDIAAAVDASRADGVDVTAAVLSGNPVRAIADYARRAGADLVVVGKNARPGDRHWSTGSFAAALGKAVPSPTMAIPDDPVRVDESGTSFRNILSAIDFSEASLGALSEALALAQQSGGRLTVLHVLDGFPYETVYSGSRAVRLIDDLRAQTARVNRELQRLIPPDALNWIDLEVTTLYGEAHEAILAAASEGETDLIVLGLPQRRRLEQLMAGSTAHKVLRRATSPVLLVPGSARVRRFKPADLHHDELAAYPPAPGLRAADSAVLTGRAS